MKTLAVHLHLYYFEQLPEILKYLGSLPGIDYDLFVTMVKKDSEVERQIKSFNLRAKIWIVSNRGYDVGPFIDFLHKIKLGNYKYILKIHTKGNRSENHTWLNGHRLDNKLWKQILFDALLKDNERVQDNLKCLEENKQIGMLSSDYCLTSDKKAFVKLLPEINSALKKLGLREVQKVKFVAGTMFYVRANLLKPLLNYELDDFSKTDGNVKEGTLAHVMERLFGILVEQQGFQIKGTKHDNYTKLFLIASLKHFVYQKKITSKGRIIIKVFRIPVYHGRIKC